MSVDLDQARLYSGQCRALAAAILDRDWFETGTILCGFVGEDGRPCPCGDIHVMMLATGQTNPPTAERIRQSRSVRNHFVAHGLGRQDARGVSLETARILCQHHRQGRLDTAEFRRAVAALRRSFQTFRSSYPTTQIRTPEGARELLELA